MDQEITGSQHDETDERVVQLVCNRDQHVRHPLHEQPPWVFSEQGIAIMSSVPA